MSWSNFFTLVREDLVFHGGKSLYQKIRVFFIDDRFQLLFNSRFLILLSSSKVPFFPALFMIIIGYVNMIVFSSIISKNTKIGRRCMFKHPIGLVIGPSIIGDDVNIFQQVTLGSKGTDEKMAHPIIGNNVTIYTHSVLLGDIAIGDNTIVAANSVVTKDLKENSIYAGSPAKKIK